MAFFKVKIDGKTYELDRLTLGDARILKSRFGLEGMSLFSPDDPDHLAGLLVLALKRERPDTPLSELIAEIEDLDIESFSDESGEEESDESDPPQEAEAEAEAAPTGGNGKKAKRQKVPGDPN